MPLGHLERMRREPIPVLVQGHKVCFRACVSLSASGRFLYMAVQQQWLGGFYGTVVNAEARCILLVPDGTGITEKEDCVMATDSVTGVLYIMQVL